MEKILFLSFLAIFCFVQVKGVAVQNIGPGTVAFLHTDKLPEASLNFRQSPGMFLLHVVFRDNRVAVATNLDGTWNNHLVPSNFHISTHEEKLNYVVEVLENGYDIYVNGKHHHFRHRLPVNIVNTINSYSASQGARIGKVLKDFSIGRVIYIKATAPSSGDFKIELLPTLPRELDCRWSKVDLVLHAKFSASPQAVTRNTYGLTCGGAQLGESDGGMPFTAGEPFELIIVAQQFGFEIRVNGAHFASYAYRSPLPRHITVMPSNVPAIQNIEYY